MREFERAKWIWLEEKGQPDSYGEFYEKFQWEQGSAICRIACDGDYTLYINGQVASFWQYCDYEHYKVYDEVDITPYLQPLPCTTVNIQPTPACHTHTHTM